MVAINGHASTGLTILGIYPAAFMPQRGKMRKPRATPWDTRPPCDPSPERAACVPRCDLSL